MKKSKPFLTVFFSVLIILCLFACSGDNTSESASENSGGKEYLITVEDNIGIINIFSMDTYMTVKAYGADKSLLTDIADGILKIENLWSVTEETSEISLLNKNKEADISEETKEILDFALDMCKETDGVLDISVYPVVKEWGFTTGKYKVPSGEKIKETLKNVDYKNINTDGNKIRIPSDSEIDLGSVAKGYVGDYIISVLKNGGIESAILDLGGNIQTLGSKTDGSSWKVGIQNPSGSGYFGILEIADKAVVTSGGYERNFTDDDGNIWWHIIDPKTGYPAKSGIVSASVIAKKGIYCDALSTSLFIMGKDQAIEYWKKHKDFDMILLTDENELVMTKDIENSFLIEDGYKFDNVVVIDD